MLRVESCLFEATAPEFNLSCLHLSPPLEMTPFEFCWDFGCEKPRVPRLLCAFICVSLRLNNLVKLVLVVEYMPSFYKEGWGK